MPKMRQDDYVDIPEPTHTEKLVELSKSVKAQMNEE